jgi:5-methylcytosine-specific restriction enzyme A
MAILRACSCGSLHPRGATCPAKQRERDARRGTTTQRGLGSDWQRVRRIAVARQPYCAECDATSDLTGDHIVPRSEGGTNTLDNVRVLCRSCNSRKSKRIAAPPAEREEQTPWIL